MDKKDAAKKLYLDGWEQSRIATALGITQKTISSWKKSCDWDKEKIKMATVAQESTERVWALIDYQTKALDFQRLQYLEDAKADDKYKLIDKGNLDALQKLFSIVKTKEKNWMDTIKISIELLEFVQSKDLKLAKKLHELVTEFIEDKRTKDE